MLQELIELLPNISPEEIICKKNVFEKYVVQYFLSKLSEHKEIAQSGCFANVSVGKKTKVGTKIVKWVGSGLSFIPVAGPLINLGTDAIQSTMKHASKQSRRIKAKLVFARLKEGLDSNKEVELLSHIMWEDLLEPMMREVAHETARIYEYQIAMLKYSNDNKYIKRVAKAAVDQMISYSKKFEQGFNRNTLLEGIIKGKPKNKTYNKIKTIFGEQLQWKLPELFTKPGLRIEQKIRNYNIVSSAEEKYVPFNYYYENGTQNPKTYGYRGQLRKYNLEKKCYLRHEIDNALITKTNEVTANAKKHYVPLTRIVYLQDMQAYANYLNDKRSTDKESEIEAFNQFIAKRYNHHQISANTNKCLVTAVYRSKSLENKQLDFQKANFKDVDFMRINMSGINLKHSTFARANLLMSNLKSANLQKTKLIKANLSFSIANNTNFKDADFHQADIQALMADDKTNLMVLNLAEAKNLDKAYISNSQRINSSGKLFKTLLKYFDKHIQTVADNLSKQKQHIKTWAEIKTWNLRIFLPENHFVGQQKYIEQINKKLTDEASSTSSVILIALYGLAGVGKTYLTLKTIHNPPKEYKFRAWFDAESIEQLKIQYIELGEALNIFSSNIKSQRTKVEMVKTYLTQHPGWLLIYDNAQNYDELSQYLPSQGGAIIVTSRNPDWEEDSIKINVMQETDAILLVEKFSGIRDQKTGTRKLVETLGYLPLALAQASAYINKKEITIDDYLKRYKTSKQTLLSSKRMPPGSREHEPVFVTWDMNMETIKTSSKQALKVLNACAYLDSNNIPKSLLAQLIKDRESGNTIEDLEYALEDALLLLSDYSMIKIYEEFVSVHRLVQTVVREKHKLKQRKIYLVELLNTLNKFFKQDVHRVRNFQENLKLLTQVETVSRHCYQAKLVNEDLKKLHNKLADTYNYLNTPRRAIKLFKNALNTFEIDIKGIMSKISKESLHSIGEKILTEHESEALLIAILLENLALSYIALYEIDRDAVSLDFIRDLEYLLKIVKIVYEKKYGFQHYKVALVLVNLSKIFRYLDENKQQKLLLKALNRKLGGMDRDLGMDRNLFRFGWQHFHNGAKLMRQIELVFEKVRTLKKRYRPLVYIIREISKLNNRPKLQMQLLRQVLLMYNELDGNDDENLDTADTKIKLAKQLIKSSQYKEAKPLLKEALAIYNQIKIDGEFYPKSIEAQNILEDINHINKLINGHETVIQILVKNLNYRYSSIIRGAVTKALSKIEKVPNEVIPALLKALEDKESWKIRTNAVEALGNLIEKKLLGEHKETVTLALPKALLKALEDKHYDVQKQAVKMLGNLIKKNLLGEHQQTAISALLKALLKALENEDWYVQIKAVKAMGNLIEKRLLGEHQQTAAITALFKTLEDEENWGIREKVVEAMGNLIEKNLLGEHQQTAITALLKASEDKYSYVQAKAVRALENLIEKKLLGEHQKIAITALLKPLLKALEDEESWRVRKKAIEAMGNLIEKKLLGEHQQTAITALLKALEDEDSYIQKQTVEALESLIGEKLLGEHQQTAITALLKALKDKNSDVRKQAVDSLGNLIEKKLLGEHQETAITALLKALEDEHRYVRKQAVDTMRNLIEKKLLGEYQETAITALLKALEDKDSDVQKQAIDAMRNLIEKKLLGEHQETAITALLKALEDEDSYIQKQTIEAMENLIEKNLLGEYQEIAITALLKALEGEHRHVRKQAVKAVKNLIEKNLLGEYQEIAITALLKPLLKALEDKDSDVRKKAVKALGNLIEKKFLGEHQETAITALLKALEDEDSYIQKQTIEAMENLIEKKLLGEHQQTAITAALLKALEDKESYIRTKAVEVVRNLIEKKLLGKHRQTAITALLKTLEDENYLIREQTVEAMENLIEKKLLGKHRQTAITALLKALKDENHLVRVKAAKALRKPEQTAVLFLIKKLRNKNSDVIQKAALDLDKILQKKDIGFIDQEILHKETSSIHKDKYKFSFASEIPANLVPEKIAINIFNHVDTKTFPKLLLVSKSWHTLFYHPDLAKKRNAIIFDPQNIINLLIKLQSNRPDRWYNYDDVKLLIAGINKSVNDWDYFVPVLGTTITNGYNFLQKDLENYTQDRLQEIAHDQKVNDKIVIPVNLYKNHWVIVFIYHPQDASQAVQIKYINPQGLETNPHVEKVIRSVPLYVNADIEAIQIPYQTDSENCGPWIIKCAELIMLGQDLPKQGEINIEAERQLQQQRLSEIREQHKQDSAQQIHSIKPEL